MSRSQRSVVRAAAAFLLATAAAPAAAQSVAGAWYASARSGITMTDQNFRNDGRHDAFAVGRAFARDYALEIEVTRETLDFDIDYGLVNESVALNLVTVNREPLWDPYFLAGIGRQRFEGPEGLPRRTGSDLMFNLGIGGQWELVVPERVYLRADLRLRYVLENDNQPGQNGMGDGVFTIGLSVPFGR
jgi:hypothetical protein